MYPGNNSNSGIFVKRQVEALENDGIEIVKAVKNTASILAYIPFILKSIFYLLFIFYIFVHAHYWFYFFHIINK